MNDERKNFPNGLAYDGAFTAGRLANVRGEGKGSCPFDEKQPYFKIWHDGFDSVAA